MVDPTPLDVHLLALPESSGSSLYGFFDFLANTGTFLRERFGLEPGPRLVRPLLVSLSGERFACGNGIPVQPDLAIGEGGHPEILVISDIWLSPDDSIADRYDDVKAWLKGCYAGGTTFYAACSGSVLLAAAGLLDGLSATSHWGYGDLFRRSFPKVLFDAAPTLCYSDTDGRIVTSGGSSSWHDLAIHIISRHVSPGEAMRMSKIFLMKWNADDPALYADRVRRLSHADSVVRRAENWLASHFVDADPVAGVVASSGIAERSLKRRFREATGVTLISYAQNLRIEAAKRALETGGKSVDEIALAVGYGNTTFFRRLFKRCTGLSPAEYRRMVEPFRAQE